MVSGYYYNEPGLGACPCACQQQVSTTEGGLDWFKLAVIGLLIAITIKRPSKF